MMRRSDIIGFALLDYALKALVSKISRRRFQARLFGFCEGYAIFGKIIKRDIPSGAKLTGKLAVGNAFFAADTVLAMHRTQRKTVRNPPRAQDMQQRNRIHAAAKRNAYFLSRKFA